MASIDWLSVTPDTGHSGITTITVSASSLSELADRWEMISVRSGALTRSVITHQGASDAVFLVSPSNLTIDSTGGSATFSITCPANWIINNPTTWATFSAVSGSGNTTITVSATTNDSVNDRSATFVIRSGYETRSVTVTQYKRQMLSLTPTSKVVSSGTGSTSVSVIVPEEKEWQILSYPEWTTLTGPTSSTSNAVIYVNYGANGTTSARTGTIGFYYNGATQYVSITQTGQDYLEVSPSSFSFPATGGTAVLSITCSGYWTSNCPDWITMQPSGFGNTAITITASTNYLLQQKTDYIRVFCGSIERDVSCTQAGAGLVVSPTAITVSAASGTTTISITANTNWQITDYPVFVTPSKLSGDSSDVVTLTYTENQDIDSRYGYISILYNYVTTNVTFTQIGMDFEIFPTSLHMSYEEQEQYILVRGNQPWTITSTPAWVAASPASGTATPTGSFVTLNIGANLVGTERSGVVIFNCNGNSYSLALSQATMDESGEWWEIYTDNSYNGRVGFGGDVPTGIYISVDDGSPQLYSGTLPDSSKIRVYYPTVWDNACDYDAARSFSIGHMPVFGNKITSIGERAFYQPRGYVDISRTLTIPDSVQTIGAYAFYLWGGDSEDNTLVLGTGLTSIGVGAFYGCHFSGNLHIGPHLNSIDGGGTFDDKRTFQGNSFTSLTLDNGITAITAYAFEGLPIVGNVTIPNTVKTIDTLAFSGCRFSGLTIGSSVTGIGEYAFLACTGLTNISMPNSVTTIGNGAFQECSGATALTLGSVSTIGGGAFSGCTNISAVTIPSTVTIIGGEAFERTGIQGNVTIPSSVTAYTNYQYRGVFRDCTGITSASVLSSTIPEKMFNQAFSLTSVTIGANVTAIGQDAFENTNLNTIYLDSTHTITWVYSPFVHAGENGTLYYHAGTDISAFENDYYLRTWTFTTY